MWRFGGLCSNRGSPGWREEQNQLVGRSSLSVSVLYFAKPTSTSSGLWLNVLWMNLHGALIIATKRTLIRTTINGNDTIMSQWSEKTHKLVTVPHPFQEVHRIQELWSTLVIFRNTSHGRPFYMTLLWPTTKSHRPISPASGKIDRFFPFTTRYGFLSGLLHYCKQCCLPNRIPLNWNGFWPSAGLSVTVNQSICTA